MFCPKCKSEYIEGITECSQCKVPLVEALPEEAEEELEYENFVAFKTYSARYEAELAKSVLEANGIHVLVASDDAGGVRPELAFFRGVQLLLKREDIQKAEDVFRDLEATQNQELEIPEEDADTEDAPEDE